MNLLSERPRWRFLNWSPIQKRFPITATFFRLRKNQCHTGNLIFLPLEMRKFIFRKSRFLFDANQNLNENICLWHCNNVRSWIIYGNMLLIHNWQRIKDGVENYGHSVFRHFHEFFLHFSRTMFFHFSSFHFAFHASRKHIPRRVTIELSQLIITFNSKTKQSRFYKVLSWSQSKDFSFHALQKNSRRQRKGFFTLNEGGKENFFSLFQKDSVHVLVWVYKARFVI